MSVLFNWRDAVVCSGAFFAIATEALIGLLLPLLALHQQLSPTELGLLVAAGSIGITDRITGFGKLLEEF